VSSLFAFSHSASTAIYTLSLHDALPISFGDHQVYGFGSDKLDIGTSGIEMSVVRNNVAFFAHHAEENAFGSPALMGGNDVPVTENILDGIAEVVEASAAGVTLVAFDQCRPLMRGHGAGPGVSQQVYEHIFGRQKKQIVMRGAEELVPLQTHGPGD